MKRITSYIMAFLLLLTLCSCGTQTEGRPSGDTSTKLGTETNTPEETMSSEEYSALLSKLNEDIYSQSVLLSNLGNYINSWWKAYENIGGTFTTEKAMSSAYEWLEKNSEYTEADIAEKNAEIQETYKSIIKANNGDSLLSDITERLKQQYTDYTSYYTLITEPSGDRNTFVSDYNDYTGDISSAYKTIAGLLTE
ncbi:MAG: hypothetical protein ACI4II_04945 [Acutalibacteraceae bacterium]